MTTHLKDGKKRDKMLTTMITKPFFDKMKKLVEDDTYEDLRNISDLTRIALKKEVKRRLGE